MDLLEKFGTVAVEVVNRISPADKDFCEKHQAAYEAVKQAFQELAFFWEDMISAQKELLGGCSEDTNHYIRMFKKGRMDIRFTSEEYAWRFASEYLGVSRILCKVQNKA